MLLVLPITVLLVTAVVALQVVALLFISDHLPRFPFRHLFKVSLGLLGVIVTHVVSIVLFGLVFYFLTHINADHYGYIRSDEGEELIMRDYIYFSFTTYTTVGYGDYIPKGPLRLLSQIEALVGLVLIACSASYIFIIMQDYWRAHARRIRLESKEDSS